VSGPPLLFNMYTADKEMRADLKKLPLNLLDALRLFKGMLTYAGVCWRMLTYMLPDADVC